MSPEEEQEFKEKEIEILIEDAELSMRAQHVLRDRGIKSLNQLTEYTSRQVLIWENLGKKTLWDIRDRLAFYGMSFKDEVINLNVKKTLLIDLPKILRDIKTQIDSMQKELRWFGYKLEQVANFSEKIRSKEGGKE